MAVRLKPSKLTPELSSSSLQKLLKSHDHPIRSAPKLWIDSPATTTRMHVDENGVPPPTITPNHPLLRKLESCISIRTFNQVHTQLLVTDLFQDSLVASRAVKKLCTCLRDVGYAVSLFRRLDYPDAFICNTIIRCFVNLCGSPFKGFKFYSEEMAGKGVLANHYTFPLVLKICATIRSVRDGEVIHGRIVRSGFEADLFVRNSLIHMYFVCGKIWDARKVFDISSHRDIVTWNSMIDGYVKNGEVGVASVFFDAMPERDIFSWNSMIAGYVAIEDMEAAIDLLEKMPLRDVVTWNCVMDGCAAAGDFVAARGIFDRMSLRNVVSWNTMLALYTRSKKYYECLELFDKMIEGDECKPNEATFVSVLCTCANLGELDRGEWVNTYIKNANIEPDVLLYTALLTMYTKCGAMNLAEDVFDAMPEKNVVSWNAMIMGYGMHGNGEKSLEIFLKMVKIGQMPNEATFICILSACTHAGMILEGWWYFDLMRRVYKIEPKAEHYGCMIDLLGRAGLMKDSEELIRKMNIEAGPALWGALLSACRTHSNLELGEVVAKRLIELKPMDQGPYVLLSNLCAAGGNWDAVERVRKMLTERGLEKVAGFSLIGSEEIGSNLLIENDSAHRKSMMYSMLSEMGAHMKLSYGDIMK